MSLVVILAVILIRFALALVFSWTMAKTMGSAPIDKSLKAAKSSSAAFPEVEQTMKTVRTIPEAPRTAAQQSKRQSIIMPTNSRFSSQYNSQMRSDKEGTGSRRQSLTPSTLGTVVPIEHEKPHVETARVDVGPGILRTIVMVTCYSEGEAGIRSTLDSLARTDFPDTRKMLFVVADGIITGSGNSKSTPDIVVDMVNLDSQFPTPEAYSYVAIADGEKRHNMAKVYAGRYHVDGHSVPTIVVVKCGTPEEVGTKKPGNRGKRDSQIILMQFLSKVMFNDRMTPLEFDLFTKMTAICGPENVPLDQQTEKITPDMFELVMMVDADTKVMPDCLLPMSYTMYNDDRVIGLCGETRIANKRDSWVSAIQVFEYYLAHFSSKAFESIFGSVTCLPYVDVDCSRDFMLNSSFLVAASACIESRPRKDHAIHSPERNTMCPSWPTRRLWKPIARTWSKLCMTRTCCFSEKIDSCPP